MFQGRSVILMIVSVGIGLILYFLVRQQVPPKETGLPSVSIEFANKIISKDNDKPGFKIANSSTQLSEANIPEEATVSAKSSSENGESGLSNAISLIKQNVPVPFIAFNKNFRITWEDFAELLAIFEAQGSPFRYERKSTGTLSSGDWYITHKGYDDQGNPLFAILDLNTFGEEANQINQYLFEEEFTNIHTSNDYGAFQPETENLIYDTIYDSLSGDDIDFQVTNLTCRESKCVLRIDHSQSTHLNVTALEQQIKTELSIMNPNKSCIYQRIPIASGGQMIEFRCD